MSYTKGNIIFGQTATPKLTKALEKAFGEEFSEESIVEPLYEGITTYFFGVFICRIDECEDVDFRTLPQYNQLDDLSVYSEYQDKVDTLPQDVKDALDKPRLMIVWEHS